MGPGVDLTAPFPSSFIQLWNQSLDLPLYHQYYVYLIPGEIYRNNFFYIFTFLAATLAFLWILYRISTCFQDDIWTGAFYFIPTKFLIKGYTRTLSVFIIIVFIFITGYSSMLLIRTNYFEATPAEWPYPYESVVVLNGSRMHLREMKYAVFGGPIYSSLPYPNPRFPLRDYISTNTLYSMNPYYIPTRSYEDYLVDASKTFEMQKMLSYGLDPNFNPSMSSTIKNCKNNLTLSAFFASPYNPITIDNITLLSRTHPSIVAKKHMFDHYLPEIYYPDKYFWSKKIVGSMGDMRADSLLSALMFFAISSLRPFMYFACRRDDELLKNTMGIGLSGGLVWWAWLRLFVPPVLTALQSFGPPGISSWKTLDKLMNYNPIMDEQNAVRRLRLSQLRSIQTQNSALFKQLMLQKITLESSGKLFRLTRPVIPAQLSSMIHYSIIVIECILLLLLCIYLILKLRQRFKETRRSIQGDQDVDQSVEFGNYTFLLDYPKRIIALLHNPELHRDRDYIMPQILPKDSPIRILVIIDYIKYILQIFSLVLIVRILSLCAFIVLYLTSPHQCILNTHPLLNDILGSFYWLTFWCVFMCCIWLLFPSGIGLFEDIKSEDKFQKREHYMRWNYMENVIWIPKKFEEPESHEPSPSPSPEPPSPPRSLPPVPDVAPYKPPGTYPEPKWANAPILDENPSIVPVSFSPKDSIRLYAGSGSPASSMVSETETEPLITGYTPTPYRGTAMSAREQFLGASPLKMEQTPIIIDFSPLAAIHQRPKDHSISPHPRNYGKVRGYDHHDEITHRGQGGKYPTTRASISMKTTPLITSLPQYSPPSMKIYDGSENVDQDLSKT